jgi:DNA-binding transcriptional LysR family regulator
MNSLRHIRVLRYIEEVASSGSARQAADRLHITPSALLRRIQDVEFDLGTPIFERSSTGVRLTAAGQILVDWIRDQQAGLRRVFSQIDELMGLRRGEVRIACCQSVAGSLLVPLISGFKAQFPLIVFLVTVLERPEALRALRADEVDLALIFGTNPPAEFDEIASIGQRVVVVMAADHPLAARVAVTLRDCADFGIVLPSSGSHVRNIVDAAAERAGIDLDAGLESNSLAVLGGIVRTSRAITFDMAIAAEAWAQIPDIVVRSLVEPSIAPDRLVLVRHKGRVLPAAADAFALRICDAISMPDAVLADEPLGDTAAHASGRGRKALAVVSSR